MHGKHPTKRSELKKGKTIITGQYDAVTLSKFHLQDGRESQRNQSFYGIPGFYRKFWKSSAFYGHGQVSHTRKRGQTITNQSHKMLLETGGQNSH